MTDEIAIRVSNVSKTFILPHEKSNSVKSLFVNFYKHNRRYEKQQALQNITFDIKKGEFFGIVGRNGSGKSTLLKILAGIYFPSKGEVQVNGKLTPFIELGVGFSPELSGRENVFLNCALLGFSRKEVHGMYNDIVAFSELERFMDQKLKNYSSGMHVRLAFSIAVRARTDILLLDEVLAVGDAAFQQKCFDYFEDLKLKKKTVVFVSHDMNAIRRFCTRAVYIKDSKIIHQGTPEEIADIYMEENMRSVQKAVAYGNNEQFSKAYELDGKIDKITETRATLVLNYDAGTGEPMYIGISILRDGISIAEITTSLKKPLSGISKLSYEIDITRFNAGLYSVGAGLFILRNRELVAANKKKIQFVLKGDDITKGGALKLEDNWNY